MRIERFGDGEPAVAVIGGIHGDEPCGVRAVEALLAADLAFTRPVVFVIANELAIEKSVRFVDEDLNRAFPGDPTAETHEGRLAVELVEAVEGCRTLSLHSTQSYGRPFGIVDELSDFARAVAPRLGLDALVEAGKFDRGRIFDGVPRTVEVECGFQGSDRAAENATAIAKRFLEASDAVDPAAAGIDRSAPNSVPVYRLRDRVPKQAADRYDVHAENFEEVAAGQVFATADDEPLRAADPFYPVLLSANGYESQFGYTADYVETLE